MESNWDYQLFRAINDAANNESVLGKLLVGAANWGDYFFFFSLLLMFLVHRKAAIFGAITVGLTVVCSRVISLFYYRERPFVTYEDVNQLLPHIHSNSFPSDHAAAAFAIAMMFVLFSKRIGIPFLGFAALVSYSRIWVGKHYPLDVIAGALLGIIISVVIYRRLHRSPMYDRVLGYFSKKSPAEIEEVRETGV
ncbi:phosphatase PAP2 family protein [Paenibacillus sp. PL2-23]|uniref:phosphatase PAP2 family protein n=1 Tax=Paenibacillus sp. PL2-23 TaxID=2100729 RepID=UPI0030F652D3